MTDSTYSFYQANSSTSLILFGGIAAWLYLCYRWVLPRPLPGIPYNKEATKTIFGDMASMIKHNGKTKELWDWITLHNYKHQSPIVQIFGRPFARPWVVVADFREAQDILLRRTKEFDRADFVGDVFLGLMPEHHISMKTDDTFKQHRRWLQDLMTPAFLHGISGPKIYSAFIDLMNLWDEKARLAQGHPFEASSDLFHTALDAVWTAVFGADPSNSTSLAQHRVCSSTRSLQLPSSIDKVVEFPTAPNPAAMESILTLTASIETSLNPPLPRIAHCFLRQTPSMKKAMAIKDNFIKAEVEKTKGRFEGQQEQERDVRCALDDILRREMLLSEKENRAPMFHSRAMYDEIFGLLIGAHDTTATAISWGLKLLTDNPSVQSTLRSDIRSVLCTAAAEKRNPTIQEITKTSMPYLDGVTHSPQQCFVRLAKVQ